MTNKAATDHAAPGSERRRRSARAVVWFGAALSFTISANAPAQEYLSPLALCAGKDGGVLYVAESTGKQVAVLDLGKGVVTGTISVPEPPSGLALSPDGSRLYITGASPGGNVHIVDLRALAVSRSVRVGHTPMAPVAHPDGKTLFVCNRFNNDVSAVDLAEGKEIGRIPVIREPVAAVLTPDGARLFVANLLPAGPADGDFIAAAISVIDTAARQAVAVISLPNGSSSARGICISPDGAYVYVTHILGRYQMPTTQLERGWMNTNALSVIDAKENKLVNTVLLDDVDLGAANPWGVACTADGKYVCVAHAGSHEISVIDRAGLQERLAKAAAGEAVTEVSRTAADVPDDLAFLIGLRRRIALTGNGPRGLVLIGTKACVSEYFTDTLGVVDIDPSVKPKARSIALGTHAALSVERKGEMFFSDASLCFQHWQSCSSCHPDARADGLNWDLLNDGIGNPKNARSMLLAHETPPAMSLGLRDSAETAVRAGITFIQFAVRPEADAAAIDAYLRALKPVPSPHLVEGKLSPAAERGDKVFEKARCAKCHPAPLYTNKEGYDLGTGKDLDKNKKLDTPALVEVWRTAPYLHDGSAAAMSDVLKECNVNDLHGTTSSLTPEETNDLIEYVLSL